MQAKRRRRKTGRIEATDEMVEGTGNVQPRCDAEASPPDERYISSNTLEIEDEVVTFSDEPLKPCNVSSSERLVVGVVCNESVLLWCLYRV